MICGCLYLRLILLITKTCASKFTFRFLVQSDRLTKIEMDPHVKDSKSPPGGCRSPHPLGPASEQLAPTPDTFATVIDVIASDHQIGVDKVVIRAEFSPNIWKSLRNGLGISVLLNFTPYVLQLSDKSNNNLTACNTTTTSPTSHDHSDVRPHASPQALATAVRAARQCQLALGDARFRSKQSPLRQARSDADTSAVTVTTLASQTLQPRLLYPVCIWFVKCVSFGCLWNHPRCIRGFKGGPPYELES